MDDIDEPYRPTVHTQADLAAVWRHLMRPLGFRGASLWLLPVGPDRRVVPRLTEIGECDDVPGPDRVGGLTRLLRMLLDDEPGGSIAVLRSRPGRGIGADDRAWAERVVQAARAGDVPLEMVHLATDDDIVPIPPDDLVRRTA